MTVTRKTDTSPANEFHLRKVERMKLSQRLVRHFSRLPEYFRSLYCSNRIREFTVQRFAKEKKKKRKREESRISVFLFVIRAVAFLVRPLFPTSMALLLTVHISLFVMTVLAIFNLVTFVIAVVIALFVLALLAKHLLVIVRVVVACFVVATLGHLPLVMELAVVFRVTVFVELVEELGPFVEFVLRR